MTDSRTQFRPRFPLHVVWLATNLCNARCLHCSSDSARRLPDELSTEEAYSMCDQLAECGVVDLAVSGGEPLLREDLPLILAHARNRGLSVGIGTNGSTLRPEIATVLAGLGLSRLQVSLDGIGCTHDELRRWPGLYDRAVRAIAMAQAAGLRTHVCFTITTLNSEQIERIADVVLGLGVKRLNLSRFVATGRGTSALELPDEAWREVVLRCRELQERTQGELEVVTHLAQEVLVDAEAARMPSFIGCQAGVAQACIQADGTVLPCVLLPIPVGNIRQAPFADIWTQSPLLGALRDRSHLEGACGACSFRERCGGCRAVAFARTGNPFATDPRCWLQPAGRPRRRLNMLS